jgi:hypothetical protein
MDERVRTHVLKGKINFTEKTMLVCLVDIYGRIVCIMYGALLVTDGV